ncbi:MAG: hypothetical protein NDJ19_06305 [Ramlibacter sp.]|nr:hypothetical protein [Ramlibacter sp.]
MIQQLAPPTWRSRLTAVLRGSRSEPFQLTRYFTVTSLIALAALAAALYFLERAERRFFEAVQQQQNSFFAHAQAQLTREQKEAARGNLLTVHEAGHVALAKVFSNALWDTTLAPLVDRAQSISAQHCRLAGQEGATPETGAKYAPACIAQVGGQIRALPGFAQADARVRALMSKTSVFKIKVYDLRGLTVYSSESSQIGEMKADNAGWKSAVTGRSASELVHRNRFSTFEGEVENRDLIQSYIPALVRGGEIGGVFEIYSDVTPFLQQIETASVRLADITGRNQASVEEAAIRNQRTFVSASRRLLLTAALLLLLFCGALLVFARYGQRIIDDEARAREQSALREQQWHRDRMETMAAMAANISHEVGNPLAIISGVAQDIALWRGPGDINAEAPRMIQEQTSRIAGMTRRITEFATAHKQTPEPLDVNEVARSVRDFLAFDRRFAGTPVDLRLGERLPACIGVRDHLTEILMSLLEAGLDACADGSESKKRLLMETATSGDEVLLRVDCECAAGRAFGQPSVSSRLDAARSRVEAMGGRLELIDGHPEIRLRRYAGDGAETQGASA